MSQSTRQRHRSRHQRPVVGSPERQEKSSGHFSTEPRQEAAGPFPLGKAPRWPTSFEPEMGQSDWFGAAAAPVTAERASFRLFEAVSRPSKRGQAYTERIGQRFDFARYP